VGALLHTAWPVRVAWVLLPLLAGPALGDALAELPAGERALQVACSAALWGGWAAVLVATLVPTTVSLTVLRFAAPAAVVTSVAALTVTGASVAAIVGTAGCLVAALVALAPETAEAFVDGSSYGDERRLPLRVPVAVLAGPAEAAWAAAVLGVLAGPLALASGRWLVGAVLVAAGLPAVRWGALAMHTLSRRWLVFVPTGFVVHDRLALLEPVLLRRGEVRSLGPAPAGSDALDLTAGASGLALEVVLAAPVELLPVARGRTTDLVSADRLLLTPSRPGRVLDEARRRRIA
jgi:hypothetical protein